MEDDLPKAKLLFCYKRPLPGGMVVEVVVWHLSEPLPGSSHLFKYRLYYGLADGTRLIRYDNEREKGDHKHIEGQELTYRFKDVDTLQADFRADIRRYHERQRL